MPWQYIGGTQLGRTVLSMYRAKPLFNSLIKLFAKVNFLELFFAQCSSMFESVV